MSSPPTATSPFAASAVSGHLDTRTAATEVSGDLFDHVESFLKTLEEEGLIGRRAGLDGASDPPTQQEVLEKADSPYRAPRLDKFDSLETLIVSGVLLSAPKTARSERES